MKAIQPGVRRGPLVDGVLDDLREWVVEQGYSCGTVPQVVTVAALLMPVEN